MISAKEFISIVNKTAKEIQLKESYTIERLNEGATMNNERSEEKVFNDSRSREK